jgi:DNA-binding transcriptional LysR family regulator
MLERMRKDGLATPASHRLVSDTGIMAMIGLGLGFSIFPRLATLPLHDGVKVVEAPLALRREFMLIAQLETARLPTVKTLLRCMSDRRALTQTPVYRAGMFHLS